MRQWFRSATVSILAAATAAVVAVTFGSVVNGPHNSTVATRCGDDKTKCSPPNHNQVLL